MRFSEFFESKEAVEKCLSIGPEYRSTIPLLFALDVMAMLEKRNAHKGPSRVHKQLQQTQAPRFQQMPETGLIPDLFLFCRAVSRDTASASAKNESDLVASTTSLRGFYIDKRTVII